MNIIREIAKRLDIILSINDNQTTKYRTSTINSVLFGTIAVVIDAQHDTKTIELFVPIDKVDEFKKALDNIDSGYKHKCNGLQFTFDKISEPLITKVEYYIKKLS